MEYPWTIVGWEAVPRKNDPDKHNIRLHCQQPMPGDCTGEGVACKTLYFNPVNPPIKAASNAFFPTTYTWALTDRECWSEFDFMRDEPRFQALAKRMTDAVEWKKSE